MNGTSRRGAALALLAGSAVACQGDAPGTERIVRDSAGVRIVEHGDVSERVAPFRLSAEPLYRVGWEPGGHEFSAVEGAALLPRGRAAVTDAQTDQLILLSAEGAVEAVLGGPGEGPGEFSFPWSVLPLAGDTFAVQDVMGNKFSLFHEGAFVRDVTLPPGIPARNRAMGVDARGRFLLGIPSGYSPSFEEPWLRMPLLTLDVTVPRVDTVAHYDFIQHRSEWLGDPFMSGFGRPGAAGGRFVVARADRMELRWIDSEGSLEQIARWRAPSRPLTDSFWAVWEDARKRQLSARRSDEEIRAEIAEARANASRTLPVFSPIFTALLGDAVGRVWIAEYEAEYGFPHRYQVVSAEGEWLGAVTTPTRSRILAVGEERVLLLEVDALDVQAVSLYLIEYD